MDWGKKITIVYLAFVALIVTLVVVSVRQKVDLVTPDYYAKELNYQADINKINNAKALATPLKCTLQGQSIMVTFPEEQSKEVIQGTVKLYKPSNNNSDRSFDFNVSSGVYEIPTADLAKGMYKVTVNWKVSNTEFQTENVVVLN
jgi:hypothetical protein